MNKYKVSTIILSITQVLTIVIFLYLFILGNSIIEKETICSSEVCFNNIYSKYYIFNDTNSLCQCIDDEDYIVHQEVIQ